MKEVFARPSAFMFNTAAEREMLGRHFPVRGQVRGHRRRRGRSSRRTPATAGFFAASRRPAPYILYAGRIEPGKGCLEIIEYFLALARRVSPPSSSCSSGTS